MSQPVVEGRPADAAPNLPPGWTAPALTVVLLTIAYALYFGAYSLMEYWSFRMHALDMGNMAEAAWNTIHGHPFYFTNMRELYAIEAWGTTTRLSFHVEALFPVIALAFLIYPHPESLLILQTLTIASGGVAVFLVARDALRQPWLGVIFSAAYFLHPSLEALNLYEFHPVALATPLLLWAFWFAWRRRTVGFVLCSLAAMGTKEQIGLTVAMIGLYVAVVNRDRAAGYSLAAAGIAWSLLAALFIEKHYRSPGTVSYLHSRYGYLGHGLRGAISTAVHHPGTITGVIFTWAKLGFALHLLLPTGFLSLLAPLALLIAAPTFLLNVASQSASMYSALGDNAAELISVNMIAAVLGARFLLRWLQPRLSARTAVVAIGIYVSIAAAAGQYDDGFTPIGPRFSFPSLGGRQALESRFVSMIPSSVPVSTQDQLDPHLADRHDLYLFTDIGGAPPPDLPLANTILLDASAPTYPLHSFQLHDSAVAYLHRPGWGVRAADNGLILIQRGVRRERIPRSFYSFMAASRSNITYRLTGSADGLAVIGYSVSQTDMTNHRVPSMAYTIYLRPTHPLSRNVQPVIFKRFGGSLDCQGDALGLEWLPTSRWVPGRIYAVRIAPIETFADSPGTVHFYVALFPASRVERMISTPPYSCTGLWPTRGPVWPVGMLDAGV